MVYATPSTTLRDGGDEALDATITQNAELRDRLGVGERAW